MSSLRRHNKEFSKEETLVSRRTARTTRSVTRKRSTRWTSEPLIEVLKGNCRPLRVRASFVFRYGAIITLSCGVVVFCFEAFWFVCLLGNVWDYCILFYLFIHFSSVVLFRLVYLIYVFRFLEGRKVRWFFFVFFYSGRTCLIFFVTLVLWFLVLCSSDHYRLSCVFLWYSFL